MRVAEALTALVLAAVAAIAIVESRRLGTGWSEDGPRAGYFPFWLGVTLAAASVFNFVAAFRPSLTPRDAVFVSWSQARLVAKVLLPTAVYVAAILVVGIYVASAALIVWFMMVLGSFTLLRALPSAILVVVILFVTFEFWFLVALPKGPLEAALGF